MSGRYEDFSEFAYEAFSRMILVIIIAVFGFVNLHYLSMVGVEYLTQSELHRVNRMFGLVALAIMVYLTLPFVAFGRQYVDEMAGKFALGAAATTWLLAAGTLFF